MNSDVSILVEQRTNALVIPNDAIGTPQDIAQAAVALHIDQTTVQQTLGSVGGSGRGGRRGGGRGDTTAAAKTTTTAPNGAPLGRGQRGGGAAAESTTALRVDTMGGRTRIVDSASGALAGVSDTNVVSGGTSSAEPHPAVVLVLVNGQWTPRRVTLGIGNYDQTEVLSGLQQGDRVALVSEIRVQASRDSSLSRIQSRSGLPGMGGGGTKGGAARGGSRGGGI
jgi:HlyD family secretion protein